MKKSVFAAALALSALTAPAIAGNYALKCTFDASGSILASSALIEFLPNG